MSIRVGIIGTGFIARGVARVVARDPRMEVARVLTRRDPGRVEGVEPSLLTGSAAELADDSDVVVECSGDAVHATDALLEVAEAGLPVVTMDSELQVTTGSYFAAELPRFTEADGDQPGCLARLGREAREMGFEPLAFVNIKGYLNEDPAPADMRFWAEKQGLRLDQVVSFTDGSKLQIEQALVANGLGAEIARDGLIGGAVEDLRATDHLADHARALGAPISDYVVCRSGPPGVLLVAASDEADACGDYGPFQKLRTPGGRYVLLRPHHLCYLEVPRTVAELAIEGRPPLLNNAPRPRVGVGAVAKVRLGAGRRIGRALGSFEARGVALSLRAHPEHVPICLMADAVMRREVGPGEVVRFDDVELPESRALGLYREIRDRAVRPAAEFAEALAGMAAPSWAKAESA